MTQIKKGNENKMGTMPMGRLVVNMSLPLMLSLLVQSLYNIVDGIFVAKLSENALTATSLAFPIQILMIAVSVGTSVGVNALLSRTIGAEKYEDAGRIATTGLFLAIVSSLVFVFLGFFFVKNFVAMFTSDPEIGEYCRQYLFICMIFCSGSFMETMFQRFLQAVGNTFCSMISLISGAVANTILDPIMIFGLLGFPALGIRGAAIATVISQWIGASVAIALHVTKNPMITLSLRDFHLSKSIIGEIYKVGLPTAITQAIGCIMISSFNKILMPFSSTAVAFYGVYYKLQNFLFMPINGLGQAAISIVGYNYGNKNGKRIKEVLRTMLAIAVVIALVATALFMAIPRQLLMLFSASEDMLAIGIPALRIISVTFVFSSVTMVLGYIVSGLGNGLVNMMGTALRQFILFIPLAYLIAKFGGITYVWYSVWFAEFAAVCLVAWTARRELKKKVNSLK